MVFSLTHALTTKPSLGNSRPEYEGNGNMLRAMMRLECACGQACAVVANGHTDEVNGVTITTARSRLVDLMHPRK